MNISKHIHVDPNVMSGKPVIKGTRIPVELILRKLGEGLEERDLLDAYPRLKREDVLAAMTYAAEAVSFEESILHGRYEPVEGCTENAVPC